jgi:hypothetical protein
MRDHLPLARDQLQRLGHILADLAQPLVATAWADRRRGICDIARRTFCIPILFRVLPSDGSNWPLAAVPLDGVSTAGIEGAAGVPAERPPFLTPR